MANRVPHPDGGRYVVHLVSLEGHTDHLAHPDQLTAEIRFQSLYSWTFTSTKTGKASFAALRAGLTQPGMPTNNQAIDNSRRLLLRMPQPATTATDDLTQHIQYRLDNGYVPLTHRSSDSDRPFAWYRGPLTPFPVAVDTEQTKKKREEKDKKYGIEDVSYGVAWTLGRGLALADQEFATALAGHLDSAQLALAEACRITAPLISQMTPLDMASAPALSAGLTELLETAPPQWHTALGRVLAGDPAHHLAALTPAPPAPPAPDDDTPLSESDLVGVLRQSELSSAATAPPMTEMMTAFLDNPQALEMIAGHALNKNSENPAPNYEATLTRWITELRLLHRVPFDHLVPHAAMLEPESLRFFRIDPNWINALTKGALQAGERSDADRRHVNELIKHCLTIPTAVSGIVIRSALVSAYPQLQILPSRTQVSGPDSPGTVLRRALLAPDVLLYLFDSTPKTVELREPFHGLHLGVEQHTDSSNNPGDWISLRTLVTTNGTNRLAVGEALDKSQKTSWVNIPYRCMSGMGAYVLKVTDLVNAISTGLQKKYKPPGVSTLRPSEVALQMVRSPEKAILTVFEVGA
jgi:hypothetical protein